MNDTRPKTPTIPVKVIPVMDLLDRIDPETIKLYVMARQDVIHAEAEIAACLTDLAAFQATLDKAKLFLADVARQMGGAA